MKKVEKALLLSILLFPGSGHVFLKRYISGFSLIITASIASYFLIYGVIYQALEIAEKIKSGEIYPDLSVILTLVSNQSSGAEFQSMNTAMMVLLVAWLVGIMDAYRVGRQLERSAKVKK